MSNIKRALAEDVDITDDRDTGFYTQEEKDQAEIAQGHRDFELSKFTNYELNTELQRRLLIPQSDVPF